MYMVSDTSPAGISRRKENADISDLSFQDLAINTVKTDKGDFFSGRYLPGAVTLMVYSFSRVPGTLFAATFSDENSTSGPD